MNGLGWFALTILVAAAVGVGLALLGERMKRK